MPAPSGAQAVRYERVNDQKKSRLWYAAFQARNSGSGRCEQLHQEIPARDGRVARPATTLQRQPTDQRNIIDRLDLAAASGTKRSLWFHDRESDRDPVDTNVQE